MSEQELKPCPFCGSDDVGPPFDDGRQNYWITCNACEADGPSVAIGLFNPEARAKLKWNRRKGDATCQSSTAPDVNANNVGNAAPTSEPESAAENKGTGPLIVNSPQFLVPDQQAIEQEWEEMLQLIAKESECWTAITLGQASMHSIHLWSKRALSAIRESHKKKP